jgi:hypothetical protein
MGCKAMNAREIHAKYLKDCEALWIRHKKVANVCNPAYNAEHDALRMRFEADMKRFPPKKPNV